MNFKILPRPKKAIVLRAPATIVLERPEDANAARRNRYQQDPAFRARVQKQNRAARRAKNPDMYTMDGDQIVQKLDEKVAIATVRQGSGGNLSHPTLSIRGLSIVLDKDYNTISSWIKRGLLPAPVLEITEGLNTGIHVYHREEIVAIIGELTRHFRMVARYSPAHGSTIDRIRAAVGKVRTQLNLE